MNSLRHTDDYCLDRHQLETICSEEGYPVSPSEWEVSAEHGLRVALGYDTTKLQAAEGLAAAVVEYRKAGADVFESLDAHAQQIILAADEAGHLALRQWQAAQ